MEECIRSIAPGRIRVRHDALKDAELAERVRGFLETKEGVRSASVNPRTGSLLLEYDHLWKKCSKLCISTSGKRRKKSAAVPCFVRCPV